MKREHISFAEAQQERMRIRQRSADKLGGAIVSRRIPNLDMDVKAVDSANICMTLNTSPTQINIAATHVPHSGHTLATRTKHYERLTHQLAQWNIHDVNITLGDFSARLMEQRPEEHHIIGKHIYRHPWSAIDDLPVQQRQSRYLFPGFCVHN